MTKSKQRTLVVLVVGASSGFGELAARKLLDLGHSVYASARRVDRMAELKKLGAKLIAMDVTDNDTVVAGVNRVIEEQGRIDAVMANAGYGAYGMIESIPMDEVQYQYDVNVFGVGRTIKAVLPQMRQQKSGRIIISASVASHVSAAGAGWYASTKHAVKAIADALRQEVRDLGIDVVLIEPGVVKTGFDEVAFSALDKIVHPDDYKRLVRGFRRTMENAYQNSPGPENTAEAMVEAATAKKPKTRYRTTKDAKMLPLASGLVSDRRLDGLVLSQFYKAADK